MAGSHDVDHTELAKVAGEAALGDASSNSASADFRLDQPMCAWFNRTHQKVLTQLERIMLHKHMKYSSSNG